ncbi:unnamed protein product [Clonostachys rosea f. rosea IK726]|uniref:Cation-transporting P-type ATPase N-terminal domain-containing protein n=2 Tax=Bionectria ochroleuca TaxID=29856 RepID=A0A0B7K3H2_BIOOC|nr:unnamed protein product [Clonostachys rosea f. rosea IK726]
MNFTWAEKHNLTTERLEFETIDWHKLTPVEIEKRLEADLADGLSQLDVYDRLVKYGENKMSPLPNPWFCRILGYFFKGFGSILCIGGVLVLMSWKPLGDPPRVANLALGVVLFCVFLIQAAFNFYQDWSTSRVMQSMTALLPESCHLIRERAPIEVSALNVVPGDVLLLKAGNKIPADLRFLQVSHNMKVDRAVLTGESRPVKGIVDSDSDNYLETHCIGLQGTHCVSGTAIGVVVATGNSTVFSQIAKLSSELKPTPTPIEKDISRFVLIISTIMIAWVLIIVAVWAGWLHKEHPDWLSVPALIVSCVSVAIAYIPEGLPVAVTSSLTITANLMKKNGVLCKSLKTVETLGAVSVICSDKTGTLTRNKMFVTHCSVGTTAHTPDTAKEALMWNESVAVDQLRAVAALCNDSTFDRDTTFLPLAERSIFGDTTDQAALRFSESLGSVTNLRSAWKHCFQLAFDSKNKFMAKGSVLTDLKGLGPCISGSEKERFDSTRNMLLTVKGAPDILLDRCTQYVQDSGKIEILSKDVAADITKMKNRWASDGKKVILLARKIISWGETASVPPTYDWGRCVIKELGSNLIFVGLLGLVDPPRDEIPEVMNSLRGAGIRSFMITGDFYLTALAVARQCGMVTQHCVHDISFLARFPPRVPNPEAAIPQAALSLVGRDLMKLNEYQWTQACAYPEIIFSRTTPDQKLRIVRELQARGQIVAMTGDGVNDAPALKAADIGISLASGSDIAIAAADMVLLDSFAAIVEAVRYGRLVFDNLKKVIAYLLPAGSWSEFWPIFTSVVFGLPQILSSFLMIIICCCTDCIAAIVLAYEKPEADLLLRPPRNPKTTKLVDWQLIFHAYAFVGTIETVSSFSMAYWYLERNGIHFRDLWFKFGELPVGIDPEYYQSRLNEASSIYFINLVIMQWFNLMAVRTRKLSIFQHPPAFNKDTQNLLLWPAILLTLGVAVIWLYIPPLQSVLNTAGVPIEHYFLPAALGVGLLCLDEGRKACVRRWPGGILEKMGW